MGVIRQQKADIDFRPQDEQIKAERRKKSRANECQTLISVAACRPAKRWRPVKVKQQIQNESVWGDNVWLAQQVSNRLICSCKSRRHAAASRAESRWAADTDDWFPSKQHEQISCDKQISSSKARRHHVKCSCKQSRAKQQSRWATDTNGGLHGKQTWYVTRLLRLRLLGVFVCIFSPQQSNTHSLKKFFAFTWHYFSPG